MTDEPTTPQLDTPEVADPEDFKPGGADLVVRDPSDRSEAFIVLDRHVEAEILDELQERALKVMLYDLPVGGGRQVDLSYQGVNEAVRLLNHRGGQRIRIRPDVKEIRRETIDGAEYVVATVMAENETTGYSQFGVAMEPCYMKLKKATAKRYRDDGKPVRDDDTIFDVFAETKALNKAQRNALKVQIPEEFRQTMIAMYEKNPDRVKVLRAGAGAADAAELPPALTDDKALEQKQRARDLYTEIKQHAPGGVAVGLTPARFHALMARAEHDHDRLDDFLAYLADVLEKAKAAAQ